MIANITKGSSATGGLAYDHGPGRRDEHRNPHKVAGNVPGKTWRERARTMDAHRKEVAPTMAKPIHRVSLNLAKEDRRLTDKEWRQVAERYVNRMGFERCPWEATRHDDGHVHLTVVRAQWDGRKVSDSHDYRRAQDACRSIEREHDLTRAERKFNRGRPQVRNAERTSAERRQVKPERDELRDLIKDAESASNGTRSDFEDKLTERGVLHRANVASTGRVSGYAYGLAGHVDADGNALMFKGSKLGKDFRWSETERRLEEQRARFASDQERNDVEESPQRQRAAGSESNRENESDRLEEENKRSEDREDREERQEREDDREAVEREDEDRDDREERQEREDDREAVEQLSPRERAEQRQRERAEERGREHDRENPYRDRDDREGASHRVVEAGEDRQGLSARERAEQRQRERAEQRQERDTSRATGRDAQQERTGRSGDMQQEQSHDREQQQERGQTARERAEERQRERAQERDRERDREQDKERGR